MKYHQRNKKKLNKPTFVVLGIFVVLILVSLISKEVVPKGISGVLEPLWKVREKIETNLSEARKLLYSKAALVIENEKQKEEIKKLKTKLLNVDIIEKENNVLKNFFNRSNNQGGTLGRVLSKSSGIPHQSLILDIGTKENIKKNSSVLTQEGILIGLIDEVFGSKSRVRLLSAAGSLYGVEIGLEGISGKAKGLGGGNFEIELPRGVDINIGDKIIAPALNPRLLGLVEWIDTRPQESLQKILFRTPVNIDELKWVLVIDDA